MEISPNPALVIPIQQALASRGNAGHALGSLARRRDDQETLLQALGALYAHGVDVDFRRLYPASLPVVSLPSAPWQRKPYWFEDLPGSGPDAGDIAGDSPRSIVDTVTAAFSSVLRVHPVGDDDSFFELGGTSLMAAQMLYDLRTALELEIPLRLLFENPTTAGFTRALEAHRADTPIIAATATALVRVDAPDYPITINQERLLQAERDGRNGSAHTLALHLLIDGPLDTGALRHSLQRVLDIHEGLRTVFIHTGEEGGIRQRISDRRPVVLPITDLTAKAGDAAPDPRASLRETERAFSPFGGPLYRFALTRIGDDQHVLSIVLHHLITDGWSQGVLFQDLVRAYEARLAGEPDSIAPTSLRLVDYACWERTVYSGDLLKERMEYWRDKLRHVEAPRVRIVHREHLAEGTQPPARLTEAQIGPARLARLEEAARTTSTTMQMVILAGFLLALRKHSGQDEITVPISSSARERPDLEKVMGFLSQPRLITMDFSGQPSRRACLTGVRDAVLAAGEEQGLSMSQFYHLEGQQQDDIPFRVSMNYLPDADLSGRLGEAAVTLMPRQGSFALFRDILLVVRRVDDGLRLSFGYPDTVISDEDMAAFVSDMEALLDAFTSDLDGSLNYRCPDGHRLAADVNSRPRRRYRMLSTQAWILPAADPGLAGPGNDLASRPGALGGGRPQ